MFSATLKVGLIKLSSCAKQIYMSNLYLTATILQFNTTRFSIKKLSSRFDQISQTKIEAGIAMSTEVLLTVSLSISFVSLSMLLSY